MVNHTQAPLELSASDRAEILALLIAGLGLEADASSQRWCGYRVLVYQEETRLKFNSLVPVTCAELLVELAVPTAVRIEAELFYWHRDQVWELVEMQVL